MKLETDNWNDMVWVPDREGVKRVVFASSSDKISCGIGEYSVGHALHPHCHPNEQMSVCLKGKCDYYVDSKPYAMVPGSWITIPPDVSHFIYVHDTDETCIVMDISSPSRPDRDSEYRKAVEKLKNC